MTIKEFIGDKVVYDAAGIMILFRISENGEHQMFLDVRAGRAISNQFTREGKTEAEAARFQDELGQWVVDAINEKLTREK